MSELLETYEVAAGNTLQVGTAFFHRHFQLLHEQPLAAHLGQGAIEDLVAAGCHAQDLNAALRI